MSIEMWAKRWMLPPQALAELRAMWGLDPVEHEPLPGSGNCEAAVQAEAQIMASRAGGVGWRNNVGAYEDPHTGRWVRYGLCNTSKKENERFKSSDLIGPRPVLITPAMVGTTIGQFAAIECKERGWQFNPKDSHEVAQLRYGQAVVAMGGSFQFYSGGPLW